MDQVLNGLVIRSVDVGERDKIITLLTAEQGAISASAPGARALKSKKLAASQLLCYSSFTLSYRKGRFSITQASVIEPFYALRLSLEGMALGCYIAQLCSFVSRGQSEGAALLSLALNTLHLLCKEKLPLPALKAVFELRLLCLLGYMPALDACARCERTEGAMHFDVRGGTLCCARCGASGAFLPSPVLAAMRHIVRSEPAKLFSFSLSEEAATALDRCCEQYLRVQLDVSLPALSFYHSLQHQEAAHDGHAQTKVPQDA